MTSSYHKFWILMAPLFLLAFGYMAWLVSYPPAADVGRSSYYEPLPFDKLVFPIGTFHADDLDFDHFVNQWYSRNFLAIEEDSFSKYQPTQTIFRLTVIPSFSPSYMFRLTKTNEGHTLVFKAANGAGGFDPGILSEHKKVSLKNTDAENLISAYEKLGVCKLSKDDIVESEGGFVQTDGSVWLLENYEKDENMYCLVEYRAPESRNDEIKKSMIELRTILGITVSNFVTEEERMQKMFEDQ